MPVSRRVSDAQSPDVSDRLRPYVFHGLNLTVRGQHGVGGCPFCGRDGKFSVYVETGLWRCFVCAAGTERGGGNALVFLRLLHAQAVAGTPPAWYADVARDRRLLSPDTVKAWGLAKSSLDTTWLIPGYAPDGRLDQLYRRVWLKDSKGTYSWHNLPTPGVWPEGKGHALHLNTSQSVATAQHVWFMEGPWDGMAISEVANGVHIVSVPGCTTWRDEWTEMCRGKHVTLWYDSDHPRNHGARQFRAGYDGMVRVAKKLTGLALSVRWIRWGPDGYDPTKPSGWDVRDHLSAAEDRNAAFMELLGKVEDVPGDLTSPMPSLNGTHSSAIEAQTCHTWTDCENAWKEAMRWRGDMSDAMAVLLAVCASTKQAGNQLFLQLVGSAGSGKTTMCEGLLVSKHCHHLEHLTGFHSGWKAEGKDVDCSLIARINGKTLVTPEADIMMSSPRFTELMSQQRRIFDGKSGATYKNSATDTLYEGLRTPWILAGTPALLDTDQSRLGDRFIRFIIGEPNHAEMRAILRSALKSERVAMLETSNGTAASLLDPRMRKAHALTGGYVDWLRANIEEQLALIDVNDEAEEACMDYAELSADLRARPNEDKRKVETHDTKELPSRLSRQNIRMAQHLAVVLNKRSVDADVLRIVRKVAFDTGHGHTLNIVQWLCGPNWKVPGHTYQETGGLMNGILESWLNMNAERTMRYMLFLRKIDVVRLNKTRQGEAWVLTDRVYDLYLRIMAGINASI